MAQWLRQNSTSTCLIGPFVDKTDGASAYTAIEVSSATIIDMYKGAAKTDITTTTAAGNAMAHVANGWYSLVMSSTQVNTVGPFTLTGNFASCLTVWHHYMVMPPDVYDGYVNQTTALWGQASAIAAVKVDTASSVVWLASSYVAITSTLSTVNSISAGMVIAKANLGSALLMMTSSLVYHASTIATVNSISATMVSVNAQIGSSLLMAASSLIYHASSLVYLTSMVTTVNSISATMVAVNAQVGSSLLMATSSLVYHASALVWLASVNTNVGAITPGDPAAIADAVWDEMITDHTTAGSTGEQLDAAGAAGDPWLTELPGTYTGIQAGNIMSTMNVSVASTLATVDSISAGMVIVKAGIASSLIYHASSLVYLTSTVTTVNSISASTVVINAKISSSLLMMASSLVYHASSLAYLASALTYQASSLVWHASAVTKITDIQGRIPSTLVSGRIDASVGAMANNVLTTAAMTSNVTDEIADGVWDEPLTGATHNVATSAGRILRSVGGNEVTSGIVASALNNSIELAAGESSVNNYYDPGVILIDSGTGAGQSRRIIEYNGSTKVATVSREWRTLPVAGSTYIIFADGGFLSLNDGSVVASGTKTVTLNAVAEDADDTYAGATIGIMAGTGKGQMRVITAYNGTTKVATVNEAWETQPAAGDAYVIVPAGRSIVAGVVTGAIMTSALDSTMDLTTTQKASVNTEMVDTLNTDTYAEPGQEAPAATNTLVKKIGYLFKFLRNKITNDGTTVSVYSDNTTTVDQKATVSESGGTVTRDEFGTGA